MIIRVLIVGAGVAGRELFVELRKHFKTHYELIGFIDDNPKMQGEKIKGLPVLGKISDLSRIIRKHRVSEVFIAIPSAQGETIRRIVDECSRLKIIFRIVPRQLEIVRGRVKFQQVREIRPEDLIGRAILKTEQSVFSKAFRGKKILVTGGAGSIGSELCRQLIQFSLKKLYVIDWWESGLYNLELELERLDPKKKYKTIIGNIREKDFLRRTIGQIKPDIVFHAAAFKHVPLMQRYPLEAVKNNVFGTENVISTLIQSHKDCVFVNISTDKVVDPSSVMGSTKLLGEMIVKKFGKLTGIKSISVRFGNVLGSQGSVVPIFYKQIAAGGPVTVTSKNMTRFFMTIPEAVQLVLHACLLGESGDLFVLDMGEPIKIDNLARLMIRLSGYIPGREIKIKYVGIRPGEKLSEELVANYEIMDKTANSKIFKIRQKGVEKNNLDLLLTQLRDAVAKQNESRVIAILKEVAPNLHGMR